MELSYDWASFQSAFFPQRRFLSRKNESNHPLFLVLENGIVVAAFAESENVSEWVGSPKEELISRFEHRELVFFEREEVDTWLAEAQEQAHYYDQMEFLKSKALPILVSKRALRPSNRAAKRIHRDMVRRLTQKHFILEALGGWWKRVFPSSFCLFVRINDESTRKDLLLFIRKGKFEGFSSADLTAIGDERADDLKAAVKYLSERHIMPVQGLSVSSKQWQEWGGLGNPWKNVGFAIRKKLIRLEPFRVGLRFVLFLKTRFGF